MTLKAGLARRALFPAAGAFAMPAFAGRAAALLPPPRVPGVAIPAGRIDLAIAQVERRAHAMLERTRIPGLAIAVVHDGATRHAQGFGVRRAGEPDRIDVDTVFQLASLSKPVGATVVAHQVGQGVVGWDTPIVRQLPWFTLADDWVTRHLTIGDLYAHRSGLPDHAGDDLEDLGHGRRAILERLRYLPLQPFRAHYAYTNFGITAAAEAVAAAAGRDWEELCEAVLYQPLGMRSTSSRFADFVRRPNRAHGHVMGPNGFEARYQRNPDAQAPAGGVSASVADMARWTIMVLDAGRYAGIQVVPAGALLQAVTPKVISGPAATADARADAYGYGFGVGVQPSGRVTLSHSGGFNLGAGTTCVMLPSASLGLVVLSNAQPIGAVEGLAREILDLVQYGEVTRDWIAAYGQLMAPSLAASGRLLGQTPPPAPAPRRADAAYAGRYRNRYFGDALVEATPAGLVLAVGPAGERHRLEPWSGDAFTFRPFGENANPGSISEVLFTVDGSSQASALRIEVLDANGLGRFER